MGKWKELAEPLDDTDAPTMKPTQEQVIAWIEEASGGRQPDGWGVMLDDEQLKRFAILAYEAGRKDENDACQKICNRHRETIAGVIHHAIRARREQ